MEKKNQETIFLRNERRIQPKPETRGRRRVETLQVYEERTGKRRGFQAEEAAA